MSPQEFRVFLFAGCFFMVGALVYVWPHVKLVKQAQEFQKVKREHQRLTQENQLLKLEMESLHSLYRVQELAENEIGMQFPERGQTVRVFLK